MALTNILGFGLTLAGSFVPILVGDDGTLNGSGDPLVDLDEHLPNILLCGMTVTGELVPFQVAADGTLITS